MKTARAFASLAIVGITGSTAWADSTLSLTTTHGDDPLHAGDLLEVTLSMYGLGEHEVAGFVAFIAFDKTEVSFVEGAYTDWPFGSHIIDPIVANGEVIALAARIDEDAGQMPTLQDADLATLTFASVSGSCVKATGFDDSPPGTELTDEHGDPVTPLVLLDLPALPTPRLSLDIDYGEVPVEPGDFVLVTLSMTLCDGSESVGYQRPGSPGRRRSERRRLAG